MWRIAVEPRLGTAGLAQSQKLQEQFVNRLGAVLLRFDAARFIRALALLLIAAGGLAQAFIDWSLVNLWCTVLTAISSSVTMIYVLRTKRFRTHPLSMVALLGYNVSALSGALLVQSASGRSLTYGLEVPIETFSALVGVQFMILGLHWYYVHSPGLSGFRLTLSRSIFKPLGLLKPPSNGELWLMGLVGSTALWFTGVSAQQYQIEYGDIGLKFIQGFMPFSLAPCLIPLGSYLFGGRRPHVKWRGVVVYYIVLVFIAVAGNSRGTFAIAALTIAITYAVCLLSGTAKTTPRKVAWSAVLLLALLPIFGALSDLAIAMVIVREERSTASPMELVTLTIDTYFDSDAIAERRRLDHLLSGDFYNEDYISNPLFARFVYTKFADLNMVEALNLSESQVHEAQEMSWQRILAMLPTPLLNIVAPDLDKGNLSFSSGDFYSTMYRDTDLGGQKTGSSIADGLSILGFFYVPILALIVLVKFIFFDALSTANSERALVFSALAMLNISSVFTNGVMEESVAVQVGDIVRGLPQMILLYLVIRLCSGAIAPLFAVGAAKSSVK
jgi:hypothetical protein